MNENYELGWWRLGKFACPDITCAIFIRVCFISSLMSVS